jgi:riboflavin synthase
VFTGIIEATGRITSITKEGSNKRFVIESPLSAGLKTDQSVSHDGVCLTVVSVKGSSHEVVAVDETLKRSNLDRRREGDSVNLERSVSLTDRMDGHLVQGHVDDVGLVSHIELRDGSRVFHFTFRKKHAALLVDKGSVAVNGVSLTVISPTKKSFSVAIIPYTLDHTNFGQLKEGEEVNLEFDILGKYVLRNLELRR